MVAGSDRSWCVLLARGTAVATGNWSETAGSAGSDGPTQWLLAEKLSYFIGRITPEEFRRQDASYDRDSALGRELLFLIANDEWARATSEIIDIARSDSVETTIKIDVDLSRIAHEAFRDRTGELWLPVLVLPPVLAAEGSQNLEPDPFATCTVTDASGALLATLPNAEVRHRVAAALAEIIVNVAVARLPDLGQLGVSASRDERLLLAAAIYRLLRSENVPAEVPKGGAQEASGGPMQRIGTARKDLSKLVQSYAGLFDEPAQAAAADGDGAGPGQESAAGENAGPGQDSAPGENAGPGQDSAPGENAGPGQAAADRQVFARVLTMRAGQVLDAFTKSAVVVVAADRARTRTVLTVAVPSRRLQSKPPPALKGRRTPRLRRWVRPFTLNRVLPRARLEIDLLLPSADADRQVQVNLPDGVSFDPWRKKLDRRAELDIRVGPPPPVTQLGYLMDQLVSPTENWPPVLYRALADLAGAKAAATSETLRDHKVVPRRLREPTELRPRPPGTKRVGKRLDCLAGILARISADPSSPDLPTADGPSADPRWADEQSADLPWADGQSADLPRADGQAKADPRANLAQVWRKHEYWFGAPMQRRTSTDTVSPDAVVARARMIEDVSQRGAPYRATIAVQVAVTDSEYFAVARFSGWMSVLLMSVVFAFFLIGRMSGIGSQQVSAEVLAFVLTLFAAIQAGRMERPDRSTLRGLLAQASNVLIGVLILPTVVLAVALAFSRGLHWVTAWALGCIACQLILQGLLSQRQRLDDDQQQDDAQQPDDDQPDDDQQPDAGQQRRTQKVPRTEVGILLRTDTPDYSHAEVLHTTWWRSTTADAMLVGRPAYGYVVRQQGATLRSLLHSAASAEDPAASAWTAGSAPARWSLRRADGLPAGDGQSGGGGGPPASLPERPAKVLALQRSGTIEQSVTFVVFRDQPRDGWAGTEEFQPVDLDASRLAPASDVSAVVGVFLGLPRETGLQTLGDHPVTAVLRYAASDRNRLGVLEIQLPVPAPSVAYSGLQWSRVQVGLRDGDYARLGSFLKDMQALAEAPVAPGLVVGVQTVSEGIPRILNPPPAAANPGPGAEQSEAGSARLVLASDLDVVAGSGLHRTEDASEQTWRLLAICSDWRSAGEIEVLAGLDPRVELAGLTTAILHGKLVILLLGHRPGGREGLEQELLASPGTDREAIAYLDKWLSREELGEGQEQPLLRVRMRTPDRAGVTLEVIESLRQTLQELAPGSLTGQDLEVWYARTVVRAGHAGVIQLTARLRANPATTARHHPGECWGPAEMSRIERRALALAASKIAASGAGSVAELGLEAPDDTVISVSLITTPDLVTPSPSEPALADAATAQ